MYPSLGDTIKMVHRGKFIALRAFLNKPICEAELNLLRKWKKKKKNLKSQTYIRGLDSRK